MTWSCAMTRDALARGELPSGREAEHHIAHCPTCASRLEDDAVAWLRELESDVPTHASPLPADSNARFAELQAEIARDRGPLGWLRGLSTRARVLVAVTLAVLLVGGESLRHPRADLAVYPTLRLALELTMLALGTVGGAVVALFPTQRPLGRATGWMWLAAALALPAMIALAGPAHVAHLASLEGGGSDWLARAAACFAFGLLVAVPSWLTLAALDRRPALAHALVPLAAGVSGLVGNLVLHVHCPITGASHLLMGHATVGVALVAAGLLLVGWRRRRLAGRPRP